MDVATGAIKDVVDGVYAIRGAAWNPNGSILFGTATTPIMRVSSEGGTATPVIPHNRYEAANQNWPQFLPDGKHFLYWVRGNRREVTGVYAASLDEASAPETRHRILATPYPAVYAGGYLLYVRGKSLLAQPFDSKTLALSGEPAPVAELESWRDVVSASVNGTLALERGRAKHKILQIVSRDGKSVEGVGSTGVFHAIRLAPDGRTLAAVGTNSEDEALSIWLADLNGGAPVPFIQHPSVNVYPVWSPDGKDLLFSSTRDGGWKVFRKRVGGDPSEQKVIDSPEIRTTSDWSRDGKLVAMNRRISADGPRSTVIAPFADLSRSLGTVSGVNARFSPDVHWVAFVSSETGDQEIYVQLCPVPLGMRGQRCVSPWRGGRIRRGQPMGASSISIRWTTG